MTPESIYRGLSSCFNVSNNASQHLSHTASKKSGQVDQFQRAPMTAAKLATLGTAGSTLALALSLPTAKAQDCPWYCYRSTTADDIKCAVAGAIFIEFGPAAVIMASATERFAIEYDKRKCAEINCGPFMSP